MGMFSSWDDDETEAERAERERKEEARLASRTETEVLLENWITELTNTVYKERKRFDELYKEFYQMNENQEYVARQCSLQYLQAQIAMLTKMQQELSDRLAVMVDADALVRSHEANYKLHMENAKRMDEIEENLMIWVRKYNRAIALDLGD